MARIGLGTNRLRCSGANVEFIRRAVELGVAHIDTAHTYAGGESEATIGEALSPFDDDLVIATKGGWGAGNGRPEVLRGQFDEGLRRLRTESVELYYLHRVDPETPLEDSLGVLKECQDAGKIRHAGLSQVDVDTVQRARQILPIAAVQNHYNLSERGSDDVVDYCAEEGIAFVPYFPLRGVHVPAVHEVAKHHGATAAQMTLAWLLRRSPAILPIPGTLSVAHLRENLGALKVDLSDEEF